MATRNLLERLRSPAEVRMAVPAPPEAVYAVLSDPETYPDWLAGAQHIRQVDDDFPSEGAAFGHEVGPNGAVTVADRTEVRSSEAPNRLVLAVHAGPLQGIAEFELERIADGTLVTLRERMTGALAVAMPLLRGPIFLRNRVSLDRLRQRFTPLVVRL
jgi:uncharacterized protein YndB with AHSA1/START domain